MSNLIRTILGCSFEVMKELGIGFLEGVYKNALCIELKQKEIKVETERSFKIYFKGEAIGFYRADLIVDSCVIVETKCCSTLMPEHHAQVINYLKATKIPHGLLINFGQRTLEYKKLYHPNLPKISQNHENMPLFCPPTVL